jgi:antitoxin MazE
LKKQTCDRLTGLGIGAVDATMKTTIQRWGNSLALCIPKRLARQAGFKEGDEVNLRANGNRIVVEHSQFKQYRLSDLLAGVTEANRHGTADFGPSASQEAW